jgi:hypothetical protein
MKAFFASSAGWLRIAAVLALLLGLGHSSGFPWIVDQTPAGLAVVDQMKTYHVQVMGFERSYFDFYVGFGVTCGLANLGFAVLLWQLASLARTDAVRVRPMTATLFVVFAGYAVIDFMYFFTAPIVLTVPAVLCLMLALMLAGRKT